jgi:hypothetical protein
MKRHQVEALRDELHEKQTTLRNIIESKCREKFWTIGSSWNHDKINYVTETLGLKQFNADVTRCIATDDHISALMLLDTLEGFIREPEIFVQKLVDNYVSPKGTKQIPDDIGAIIDSLQAAVGVFDQRFDDPDLLKWFNDCIDDLRRPK